MVKYVTQVTRCRFGQVSLTIHLVLKGAPNDIRSLEVEGPTGRSGHALIHMQLSLQVLVSLDKYGRMFSEVDQSRLGLGIQTRWEAEIGRNFADR